MIYDSLNDIDSTAERVSYLQDATEIYTRRPSVVLGESERTH